MLISNLRPDTLNRSDRVAPAPLVSPPVASSPGEAVEAFEGFGTDEYIPSESASSETEEGGRSLASRLLRPLENLSIAGRLLGLGQLYNMKKKRIAKRFAEQTPLKDLPAVELTKPFVLIPGWTTTREAFDPLVDKLTEGGRNGGSVVFVSEGEFFLDRALQVKADQNRLQMEPPKVFEVVFSDTRLPPDQSSKELPKNFAVIKALTGEEKLDVSAFSMGGLATRAYLDAGGEDIDQLMFLGTPHQGAKFADLARETLRRDIGWAVSLSGLLPTDLPALDWLAPVESRGGNPRLQQLNERWPEQKAQVNRVQSLGGLGTVSAVGGLIPFGDGDGLVAAGASAPPGETPVLLPGQHHTHLNNDPLVYGEMQRFFGWETASETPLPFSADAGTVHGVGEPSAPLLALSPAPVLTRS